jgi:hypothetical protein
MKELALRQKWLVPRMVAPADTVGVPAPDDAYPLEPSAAGAEPEPHAHSARHAPAAAADSACWPRRIIADPLPAIPDDRERRAFCRIQLRRVADCDQVIAM